ncbi:hypothetical protein L3X38_043508 [Prunus dulcis]|uniref:Uncharacterized protein n=1 Tax=Prunus dulcis TaxID=3755 RepID=A0AAD4YLB5_PRUDU|nr:hypothetical protein L3X38_043508 [Prunus dulcis]
MAIALHLCHRKTRPDLFFSDSVAGKASLNRRKLLSVRCSCDCSSTAAVEPEFDAKVFRKNYNCRGFGHKEATLELMNRDYTGFGSPTRSSIIQRSISDWRKGRENSERGRAAEAI